MTEWNFADFWELVAQVQPDAPAITQGDRTITWHQLDARADALAHALLERGAGHQDKVAQYLHNCPEYLESVFACFKASLAPVNTNYRYSDDELLYLWDNCDAVAVVFHGCFCDNVERIRDRLPGVRTWLWVDDGSGTCPPWAVPYESLASRVIDDAMRPVRHPSGRSGRDLWFLYTGGTTGMPKGTMWEQDTIIRASMNSALSMLPDDMAGMRARLLETGVGPTMLVVPPLMHGTGQLMSLTQMSSGAHVVLSDRRSLDAADVCRLITTHRVNVVVIIGDTMTKPVLAELDAHHGDGTYDLSSVLMMLSSGVMWSEGVKQALLRHNPAMVLFDSLGSSEAVGMASTMTTAQGSTKTASFALGDHAVVITDDGRLVEAGSGEIGRVGIRALTPIGYYKDPAKSAQTFPVFDGVRYALPGDFATVEADGSIVLLGRGSQCINTGGEKVFPEEVEEVLKLHDTVHDAVVVGVPDDRFGESVTAVVELMPGATLDAAALRDHVKTHIAHFKAPRQVVAIGTIGRAPNAKVDYKRLRTYAAEQLGIAL
ncbi:MAG: AMP-binding protein [Acidimicrobiia bacterium]